MELAKKKDFSDITEMINTLEQNWKVAPSASYFADMEQIANGLRAAPADAKRFWLCRATVWKILLKPFPPTDDVSDIYNVQEWKQDQITIARMAARWDPGVSPEMNVAARHDTALMFLEYSRQIHAQLIPNYHGKSYAPAFDSQGRRVASQTEIDNAIQDRLQSAVHGLPNRHMVYYLIEAYSHEPRDPSELKELLDALGIQDGDRESILRATDHTAITGRPG
jgi:hypothetical protein